MHAPASSALCGLETLLADRRQRRGVCQQSPPVSRCSPVPGAFPPAAGPAARGGSPVASVRRRQAVQCSSLKEDVEAALGAGKASRLRLLSGSSHTGLAQEIAHYLGTPLTAVLRKRFADGECYIQVQESIRGCDLFLVQPTCSPVADSLMELMLMVDACRRASARTITVVIPYFGYARADRKSSAREAITAKLVANLLTESGAHRVVGLDLHSGQLEGYFDLPVVHVQAGPLLARYIAKSCKMSDITVVSPDVGGVSRARVFAKALSDAPLAIIDKRRTGHNQAQTMNLIGDVAGRDAVLVDDMIDTAGTLYAGAELLHAKGARAVYAVASHALFSGPAVDRLKGGLFKEVVVTNSIPLPPSKQFDRLTVLSVAALLGETIRLVQSEMSVENVLNNAGPQ